MNKELREMLEAIANKKEAAKDFLAENKIDEARAAKDEAMALQNKFDIAKDLYDEEKAAIDNKVPAAPKVDDVKAAFVNALRKKFDNTAQVKVDADGGFTVPADIQTRINELRESKDSLEQFVTVEDVTAPTGARTFKKRSQQTGFVKVDELGAIPEKATPQFTRLPYSVEKFAGFLTSSNELLGDSDASIENTLVDWIGDESRVTRNQLILSVLSTKAKTAITTVDDIKKALNVTLDPAFRNTSMFITNQDGYNWMDTLKDEQGRYLLQDSISAPTGKQFLGKDVAVVSNKDLATSGSKVPVILGDLKEAVVLFDRKHLSIKASDVAGDAYLTDSTLFRAIERLDVKMRDEEAFVYGQVDITPVP